MSGRCHPSVRLHTICVLFEVSSTGLRVSEDWKQLRGGVLWGFRKRSILTLTNKIVRWKLTKLNFRYRVTVINVWTAYLYYKYLSKSRRIKIKYLQKYISGTIHYIHFTDFIRSNNAHVQVCARTYLSRFGAVGTNHTKMTKTRCRRSDPQNGRFLEITSFRNYRIICCGWNQLPAIYLTIINQDSRRNACLIMASNQQVTNSAWPNIRLMTGPVY